MPEVSTVSGEGLLRLLTVPRYCDISQGGSKVSGFKVAQSTTHCSKGHAAGCHWETRKPRAASAALTSTPCFQQRTDALQVQPSEDDRHLG